MLFLVVVGGRGHLHEPPITLATALRNSDASSPKSLGIGSIAIITDSLSPLHFIGTNNSQLKHGQLTMTLGLVLLLRVFPSRHSERSILRSSDSELVQNEEGSFQVGPAGSESKQVLS